MPDFITTGRIKSMNQQQYTPSQTKTDRIASMLGPVNTTVTTSTGKQYTLDDKQVGWIQNRYKSKMADTYGYDDADQLAKRNGQLSAAALKTYGNTNVDRKLAELGLPSEKELGKYLEDYSRWHTGGMDQVFGQMNLPKDYWTKTKGFYQQDMQKAYENTAEDQQRKARGLMPSKWEEKYTDTEIDEQLQARGLPPLSEFGTYAERWDNYQGIENFYANVARNETNLRLAGIKDDDNEYSYTDPDTGVVKSGVTGKQLYTDAFFDELDKVNDDGSLVYSAIRPLFKNSSTKEATPTGDYLYDRGAAVLAENKNAVSADDYTSYNAFSYDDYKSKYNDYYERYFANQQITSGQTVSERLAVQKREEDAEATRSFYDPKEGEELAFIQQWRKENPKGTAEDMFADMLSNGASIRTARRVMKTARASENSESTYGGKNKRDDGWGWSDIGKGFVNAKTGNTPKTREEEAENRKDARYDVEAGNRANATFDASGEKADNKIETVQNLASAYDAAYKVGDKDALYSITQKLRALDIANREAADTWLKENADLYSLDNAIEKAKSYMDSNGKWTLENKEAAMLQLRRDGFDADTVNAASEHLQLHYGTASNAADDEKAKLSTPEQVSSWMLDYAQTHGDTQRGEWTEEKANEMFKTLDKQGVPADVVMGVIEDEASFAQLAEYADQYYTGKKTSERINAEVQDGIKSANEFIDATLKEQGEDEATIDSTKNAIRNTLAAIIDENDSVDVDTVLSVLDQVSKLSSTNYTAMKNALEDLGFSYGVQDDWAGDITAGWSDEDLKKLQYGLFDYMSGIDMKEPEANDKGGYITEKVADTLGDEWVGDHFVQNKALDTERFEAAVEWAQQEIASGRRTEWEAYQVLAAMGLQDEMQTYMGDDWHRAHYVENVLPGLWAQAEEPERLLYEEMTPEERRAADLEMWNNLSAEKKSAIYDSPYWWEDDPSVYRTFGQSFTQQMKMVLPGLAAEIVGTPVKVLDAIDAGITGRPELSDATKWIMNLQSGIAQYGSVADNVNGAHVAQTAADVVQEIGRMYYYGSIGGAIGGAFAGTSAGAAVMSGAASSSKVVRGASKMFMSMVKSSPFMVSAFANNYSEVKDRGASNSEATWFGLITGLSEGILEGFEFDELWGKALGQKNFAELLTAGKHTYLERLGIIGKSWVSSMAVSGLGEFTEESIGYVLETFLKMRHSDTWGKGTEWSTKDWLQQAMMGFITGALGGGIAAGSSWVADGVKLTNAMKNNPQLQSALPDVLASIGIAESVPDSTMATYREGGASIMSKESYDGALTALKSCTDAAQNNINEYKKVVAAEDLKLENRLRELDGYAAKVQSIDTSTGKGAKELANLVSSKLGVKLDMSQPLAPQVKAAFKASVDSAVRAHDTAVSDIRASTETALQNSELELQDLQKKFQEHYVGLYLQNEGLLNSLSDDMLSNLAQAYQNGAKYEPGQAAEQQAAKQSKLAEAEANETMAEAEQAAKTPEDAATKARELAYNRVYKDQEAGKAYAEGRRGEGDSNMTRVQFAENERQNFQAKTTARLRRVTLELAGLEAKEGMSAKEIFEEAKKAMTPEAAQKLDMYQKLSKALGLNMVVRDVVAGTSGYVHDGKLYVTLNGKQSMLRVASHELTHYMKDHASAQYDALRAHLVNEVGQERFGQMLAEKAQEYGLDFNDAKARLEADDEVCAELCERMLENQDALERFVQSDLDAAKTLKARLGKTLVAIKSAIRSLGTSDAQTKADYIKEQETIESWYKGLSEAIDNANRAKGRATAETATVTDTTTEAPQAPPVETNPDLFMGDESARREQLRAELQELAKKGTRVNGLSYQEVNDVLDRVILGDKSNYSKADYAQIRGMLSQLIPEVQAMVNGGESVDVDALNERVSAALDYMLERYSEGSEDYYGLRDLIPNKIALTEAAYNELRSRDMTLREASNELRNALGGKFVSFVYKKSPDYNNAMSIDELWTRITDAYGEPDGYGNIGEDALALIDYAKERNTRSSFDDLYGSQREDVVNAQVGEFLDAVQSMVEGKTNGTRYIVDRENDLHTRFTDDTINKAKELASRGASEEDVFNETGIYLMPNGDLLDGDTGTTLWRASANGNTQRPDNVLDASSEEAGVRAVQEYDLAGNEREGELVPEPGRARRSWESLSEEQKTEVTNTINSHLENSANEESNMFFQGWPEEKYVRYIYDAYRDGDAVLEWVCKFVPNIDALISDLNAAMGDTRYLLDEDYVPGELDEDAIDEAFIEDVDESFYEDEINRLLGMRMTTNNAEPVLYDRSVDAQGNKLSNEQVSYFQDSQVRSRDGQLRPVYHYTNGTFTEFAPMPASEHSNRTLGDGYYVSVSPTEYKAFGKNRMVMYANITNPFEMEMTPEQAAYVYDKYAAPFHNDQFGLYREHAVNALQSWGKSMDYLKQYASENGIGTSDILKDLGYDGIHDGPDWVAFDSNQLKFTDNKTPTTSNDLRFTVDDDLIQRYGAIEQGREPRARDVQVPRQSADNMRVSKFTRSLDESSKVTNAQAAEIQSEIGSEADRVKQLWSYIPKSNDETMRKAKEFIAARQPATAQREFHDMVVGGKYGTKTAAIGLQLLADASARDDWASVKEIAYDLRVLATEAGQSAQIFNVLKDLGGVGSAWYVEKLVNNLNTMYADEIQSGQMDPITVSEAAMNQVRAAKTQVEVDAAERLVADEIGPQLPLKLDEKLSNWRYLSMLGNPVTHIRNVTGNKLMHLMGGIKDVVASGVQRILEKTGVTDESDRAHARLTSADKSYWDDFAQKSYDEQKRNLQGGGKLGFQSLVQQSKRSFDNKVLDTIARGKDPGTMSERKGLVGLLQNIRNNGAMGMLEVEDAWGLEKNYKRSLMEYMKAQEYSLNDEGKVGKVGKDGSFTEITNEQMNKAIEWATNQAWTNTFRGPSQLATELNKISKMNTASKLIVEGVMPFKKTPINIAKQGAMYSPAGIVVGTAELLTKVKQGKMSAATAIDHLSSGLTGTALMALGVVLAKAGILRGGGEDKKKLETYLEDTGDQTYAFKFGNVSINMSAIAPATIPLFMGVALQEMLSRNGEDEGVDLSTITDVLAGTLNPFMEMSFMSSLNSALKNYNNEGIGGALGSTIMTAAQNYGSQYLPTLGGKVAQFIDPTQRTTKSSATSPVGGNMDYYWRSLVKKVPGAEATLQPDVNIWGQTTTKDSFGDWALDFANKFILPTNVKVTNRDAVDNELIRVVESTGNVDFLPSDGAKYFKVKGETYKMNASQYTQYSQERGQAAYAALKDVMASASYKMASDENKAAMLKKALDAAYKQVSNQWKEKLGAYDNK